MSTLPTTDTTQLSHSVSLIQDLNRVTQVEVESGANNRRHLVADYESQIKDLINDPRDEVERVAADLHHTDR